MLSQTRQGGINQKWEVNVNPIKNLKNNWKNPIFKLGFLMMGIVGILMIFNILPATIITVFGAYTIWTLILIIYEAFKPKRKEMI